MSVFAARRLALPAIAAVLAGCARSAPPAGPPSPGFYQEGVASWYGPGFAGRPTASGEIFDPGELTAAHRTLPFGTWLRVIHVDNGREVVVRVNDRGPFIRGRILDLSEEAARRLGMIRDGLARVRLYVTADGS